MTFLKKLLFLFFSIIIIFLIIFSKKRTTENFVSIDDLPENIKKEIGKAYNVVVLSPNQKVLPYTKPANINKIDPYNNLSVCTIDRVMKKYKNRDYMNNQNKKQESNSKNDNGIDKDNTDKKNTKMHLKKKFYDNYYGIANAPSSEEYINKLFNEKKEIPSFIQGNICKLSPWSLWSDCNYKCGENYGKKTRTRKVLKEPKGCYSPLNPTLTQTIPCNSTMCFL